MGEWVGQPTMQPGCYPISKDIVLRVDVPLSTDYSVQMVNSRVFPGGWWCEKDNHTLKRRISLPWQMSLNTSIKQVELQDIFIQRVLGRQFKYLSPLLLFLVIKTVSGWCCSLSVPSFRGRWKGDSQENVCRMVAREGKRVKGDWWWSLRGN